MVASAAFGKAREDVLVAESNPEGMRAHRHTETR
jgi:hypothetical protein